MNMHKRLPIKSLAIETIDLCLPFVKTFILLVGEKEEGLRGG
jgi:hypothetical protein